MNEQQFMYTEDQLMARLKFFIGICLALTLTGIVFVVLYSIIFVTQPLNAISPIDQKFFELIIPIATFLTGTLSGIMLAGNDKEAQKEALKAANAGWGRNPQTSTTTMTGPGGLSSSISTTTAGGSIPSRPTVGGVMSGIASAATGFGMGTPPQMMTKMPDLEPGDPTHRNFRND